MFTRLSDGSPSGSCETMVSRSELPPSNRRRPTPVHRLTAVAAISAALLGLAGVPAAWGQTTPARAHASGSNQKVLLTVAARSCPTYQDITANLARNNIQESLQDLGVDTLYQSGEPISYSVENEGQPNCSPSRTGDSRSAAAITAVRSRALGGAFDRH